MFSEFLSCAKNYLFFSLDFLLTARMKFRQPCQKNFTKFPQNFDRFPTKKNKDTVLQNEKLCPRNVALDQWNEASTNPHQDCFGRRTRNKYAWLKVRKKIGSNVFLKNCLFAGNIPMDTIIETTFQNKNSFTADVLDMQNGSLTNLQKKNRKMSKTFSWESKYLQ